MGRPGCSYAGGSPWFSCFQTMKENGGGRHRNWFSACPVFPVCAQCVFSACPMCPVCAQCVFSACPVCPVVCVQCVFSACPVCPVCPVVCVQCVSSVQCQPSIPPSSHCRCMILADARCTILSLQMHDPCRCTMHHPCIADA